MDDERPCVIAALWVEIRHVAEYGLMALVGMTDADRQGWWVLNARASSRHFAAQGFSKVGLVSAFDLQHRRRDLAAHHLVAHARQ